MSRAKLMCVLLDFNVARAFARRCRWVWVGFVVSPCAPLPRTALSVHCAVTVAVGCCGACVTATFTLHYAQVLAPATCKTQRGCRPNHSSMPRQASDRGGRALPPTLLLLWLWLLLLLLLWLFLLVVILVEDARLHGAEHLL